MPIAARKALSVDGYVLLTHTSRPVASELHTYLTDIRMVRMSGGGVAETSYYPALSQLLNRVGRSLRPKVRCIINLTNTGGGIPDGGLFTADQFQRSADDEPLPGQPPARGVVEAKPASEDAWLTAETKQVSKYWLKYGLVLVTNFRDFLLVGRDAAGNLQKLESYRLAASEPDFWKLTADPERIEKQSDSFVGFLKRVMLYAAPIDVPKDLAWFLASYAREAKARIQDVQDLGALDNVKSALEDSLGLKFRGPKGEHFFRSTFIQTLFYGMFSAWVLHVKEGATPSTFDWRKAEWSLKVPIIRALFEQVATPGKLEPLRLVEVLDWASGALKRVSANKFFEKFDAGQAVQYFYEPFLANFDPQLRKEMGVWFTPPEIVRFMVRRVDAVLRTELGIENGFADERVVVLDPACGTGAYLVEVIRLIHDRVASADQDGLAVHYLKKAVLQRVFGFEILPAPFVVAHLQIGLLLHTLGAPFSNVKGERAAVYLTNALTGWDEAATKAKLAFPELQEERDAAEHVKHDAPILVVLGNPPYNAFAGTAPEEEHGLVEPYKKGLVKKWRIKKFNLDELYVRFFRLAERRIAEHAPRRGVVSFIANSSWVTEPSFVVMRQHLLANFDRFWIENMHGNRKITERGPDGKSSETIFAIAGFSPGIKQGVAISLWVKTGEPNRSPRVLYRDDLNASKASDRRAQLLASLDDPDFANHYELAEPSEPNRYTFRPAKVNAAYASWPKVTQLTAEPPSNGLMEKRGDALIDTNRAALRMRMEAYYDSSVTLDTIRSMAPGLADKAARFDPSKARKRVLASESFDVGRIRRYLVRPFDIRWAYYSPVRPLWNEPRPTLWKHAMDSNEFVLTRFYCTNPQEGKPFFYTRLLSDDHVLSPDAIAIPIVLRSKRALFSSEDPNLSPDAVAYITALGLDTDLVTSRLIWMHVLAVGFSQAYVADSGAALRSDWPRIPLPDSADALKRSGAIGAKIAALLDSESGPVGVVTTPVRSEMQAIANIRRVDGNPIDVDGGDLKVSAGWGYSTSDGATMPAGGKYVERAYSSEELFAFTCAATTAGVDIESYMAALGSTTFDLYLNANVYWSNVPVNVWRFTVGTYPVLKKWLSYREHEILRRDLAPDEAREFSASVRRIAALLLLGRDIDENYESVKSATYSWSPAPDEALA